MGSKIAPMQTPPRTESPKIGEALGRLSPFEVTVYPGEDVVEKVEKLLKVCNASNRSSCIISASGHISKAKFSGRSSKEFHIYDGHFEILSMSGNFVDLGDGSLDWSMSVTLAGSDRVAFGGMFIDTLIASDTVILLMMTFVREKEKSNEKNCNCDEGGTSASDDDETIAKASSDSATKKKILRIWDFFTM